MTPTTKDFLKLHFIVFLWGFTAVLGKLVSIPSVEMVFYRTVLASAGMAVLMFAIKGSFKVSTADLIKLVLIGVIVAVHWLSFFGSGRISNPSTSLVGFATCSFWAAFLEPIMKRKKIQSVEVGLGIVVLSGLAIIFSFDFQYPLGLLLGIVSGMTVALFSVINSKMVMRVSAHAITFYEMTAAAVAILLFLPLYQQTFASHHQVQLSPTLTDWIYIAIMAWICSVYAYAAAINLTKRLSVFFVQLALNLEPVYGILLALLVFGDQEVMGWNFYLGTLMIVSAVVAYPFVRKKPDQTLTLPAQ